MKPETTYQIVNRTIERHFGSPKPQPVTAMFARSLLKVKIEEDRARLETMKAILFSLLYELAENKHCSNWREISNMIDEVAALERSIADDQRTLNDSGLWDKEDGNA